MPMSSEVSWTASPIARMFASRFACVSVTPFGSPVEPEVYWSSATSLGLRRRLHAGRPAELPERAAALSLRLR